MSRRAQQVLVWWGIVFLAIWALCLIFLLHMIPPPGPRMSPTQVAHFYSSHNTSIKIGATISGWTTAFMVPFGIVCGVQIARLEKRRVWSIAAVAGGATMSIFLVLPPLFWGVAAYTPGRNPEITTTMHELGMLTLTTTDQYYLFLWVPIAVLCFTRTDVPHSPFPRWFGYLTVWIAFMFEAGAVAFLTRTGPFAWNGLLVFWSPLTLFAVWLAVQSYLLLRAIRLQGDEGERTPAAPELSLASV